VAVVVIKGVLYAIAIAGTVQSARFLARRLAP
jgi:hypothetical protein